MKIDDVVVGKAYVVQQRGIGVVVEIGKLADSANNTQRILEWNGGSYTFHGWYQHDDSLASRRVALVQLDRTVGRVIVVTAAQLTYEPQENVLKAEIAKHTAARVSQTASKQWEDSKTAYEKQIIGLIRLLTPDVPPSVPYWTTENPYGRLMVSDVLPKMVLLYLQYHQMRDEPVNGHADVESLIDQFRGSVTGLREMVSAPRMDLDALTTAARSHIDSVWNSSGCLPKITIKPATGA